MKNIRLNTPDIWQKSLYTPTEKTHKHLRGHSVVIAGEMHGATRLASRAARRVGSGLTTILCTEKDTAFFAHEWPGTIISDYNQEKRLVQQLIDEDKNAFLIGCGGGQTPHLEGMVTTLLDIGTSKAVVLDADALNIFQNKQEKLFKRLHMSCVLTPHMQEFLRLFPDLADDTSEAALALAAAKRAGCVLVLKGAETHIASPDGRVVSNTESTPWLATAGTGDVLSGLIVGLLAQGVSAFEASCCAVWIHSQSALSFGGAGLLAEDVINGIPAVLQKLYAQQ